MIKLMFPAFVCVKEFLDKDSEQYPNMTREYFKILKDEMDNMQKLYNLKAKFAEVTNKK